MCVLRLSCLQVSVHLNLIRAWADLCYGSTLCVVWPRGLAFPRARGAGGGRPSIDLVVAAIIRREKKKNVVQMGGMPERRDGDRLRSCSALARRSVPV